MELATAFPVGVGAGLLAGGCGLVAGGVEEGRVPAVLRGGIRPALESG